MEHLPNNEIQITRGWVARRYTATLPGRPSFWCLEKSGYPPFQFPMGDVSPSKQLCGAIVEYIELHCKSEVSE